MPSSYKRCAKRCARESSKTITGMIGCVPGLMEKPGTHPIIPVMVFEDSLAQRFAQRLYELGIFVTGFCYPVVPMGQARVRVQLSAAHTRQQLDDAIDAMSKAGRELGILQAQT